MATGMATAYRATRALSESDLGPAIGISTTFDLGGRQLIVTWAPGRQVDHALAHGRPADVLAACGRRSPEGWTGSPPMKPLTTPEPQQAHRKRRISLCLASRSAVESVMPDGPIFSLTVR
jgi:hypothetical protein